MFKNKKIYRVNGVLFFQEDLKYFEQLKALQLVKEKFAGVNNADMNLEQLVNLLMVDGVLEALFKIIVKPYDTNPFCRLWNLLRAKQTGIDTANPITYMTGKQIAQVMTDFFIFYSGWMNGLVSFNQLLAVRSPETLKNSPGEK